MKAMILAAGLGKRMRPLTDTLPKPLLRAGGKPLIQYHIERLREAGITDVVINTAYLGEKIRQFLGGGRELGVTIVYSEEPQPLETGGAVNRALNLLGPEPFLLVNADIWTDYSLAHLSRRPMPQHILGHLVFVSNPKHNRGGDYMLDESGYVVPQCGEGLTFSGVSMLSPGLIEHYPRCRETFPLREALDFAIANRQLTGEIYDGDWRDIGTPERLQQLDRDLSVRVPPD